MFFHRIAGKVTSKRDMSGAVQRLFHWWITLPWSVWLDQTNKLTQILAVVAGGLGALLKFGIGAEVFITGSPFQGRGSRYLIVAARFKNTGAVKLYLSREGLLL